MGLISGIWMIVLGILGASSLIIARKPDASELIAKLTPFQGWIGAVSALWGVWTIISSILNISWLSVVPIWWATFLAIGIVLTALGLLLGIGVIRTFVKHPEAIKKIDMTVSKLAPYQGKLGLVSIGLGVWGIVAFVLYM